MTPDLLAYLALSFLFGALIVFAFVRMHLRRVRMEFSQEQQRSAALEAENKRIPSLEAEKVRLTDTVRVLQGDRDRYGTQAERIPMLERTLDGAQRQITELRASSERLAAELDAERTNYGKLKQDREELTNEFEAISKRVLTTSNHSFLTLAEQKLGQYQQAAKGDLEKRQQAIQELVAPLATKLKDFEQKVEEVYRTEAAERNSLRGEIKSLVELNQQISKEASNLAQALKTDTKKQGNWGELILEKVLEFSGLRKGDEYKLQVSLKTENGSRVQPDAIVYLPEKKHIVVDSKVSLVAYERYVSTSTDEERNTALLDHIASVKKHIKELSEKDYASLSELDSPDFTLLFMPIESSFGLAIQADNELFEYAWNRKIVIVSPSTLLATLRTIASIWKQERQTKNALDIADRAGKMYDKFVGFVDDMIAVGKKMDDAKIGYSSAMNKLSTGAGNLVRQSEQLKDMGAKATKSLPGAVLDRSTETLSLEPIAAGPGQLI